ncbi:MAG: class I SAM-dependent methyltransferase [Planctomycetota bacterium]|nr:class I SAM-dependent methyltransferase [Planctomycetota bacterium]
MKSSDTAAACTFVDPADNEELRLHGDAWLNPKTNMPVAHVVDGIPRFVDADDDYAENFGFQWNTWENELSEKRGSQLPINKTLRDRTKFELYETRGKTILECGMGGGDDTEVLLEFPFKEIHSFDLSRSVHRAAKHLTDPRLTISQSSIFSIPYKDESFDFVFCHRVLQHTPDPVTALRAICKKVKPGGILFAHSYKASVVHLWEWRYKYRWFTKRIPQKWVYLYVQKFGFSLHRINQLLYRIPGINALAYGFIPFYHVKQAGDTKRIVELEKLITFDALTPKYDKPMSSRTFRNIITSEGFSIEHIRDPIGSPIFCTAVKNLSSAAA